MDKYAITKGSIADIMQREDVSLAESFLSCDCVVLFDVSGSMAHKDDSGATRFDRGIGQLREIQADYPGRFAIIQFADRVDFMPGGVPAMGVSGFCTDLTAALKYAAAADAVPDMRFIVISDGEPDNEATALAAARGYSNAIDTIYIGEDDGGGKRFLQQLARASGGASVETAAENIGANVLYLLSERAG